MTPRPIGDIWHWSPTKNIGCTVFISVAPYRVVRFLDGKAECLNFAILVPSDSPGWHEPKETCKIRKDTP